MKLQNLMMTLFLVSLLLACSQPAEKKTNIYSTAPEGAIMLFNGSGFSAWKNCDNGNIRWKIVDDIIQIVPDST